MHWTETPIQVKGFLKRRDIVKWEIDYFPEINEKKWTVFTSGKPKIWEWTEKNVNYGKN